MNRATPTKERVRGKGSRSSCGMTDEEARKRCMRLLRVLLTPAGVDHFLSAQQPAYEDRTGAALLDQEPKRLLMALELCEKGGSA